MSNKEKNTHSRKNDRMTKARRALLKSIVAGGGVVAVSQALPEKWIRPVVQSVALPAHAQTSPQSESPSNPLDGLYVFQTMISGDAGSILDMFISPAQALVMEEPLFTCKEVVEGQIRVNGDKADICLSSFFSTAQESGVGVDLDTGAIDDVTPVGMSDVDLTGMKVSADNNEITGTLDKCGSFTAPRKEGVFGCKPTNVVTNVTMTTILTSPFKSQT